MDNVFAFLLDAENYSERMVDRYQEGKILVSTACVSDGDKLYETAIEHPEYKDGKIIVVEAYDTRKEAKQGHERWLKIIVDGPLPDYLLDCQNAKIGQLAGELGVVMKFYRQ